MAPSLQATPNIVGVATAANQRIAQASVRVELSSSVKPDCAVTTEPPATARRKQSAAGPRPAARTLSAPSSRAGRERVDVAERSEVAELVRVRLGDAATVSRNSYSRPTLLAAA